MNEKLILRAAIKYHKWLLNQHEDQHRNYAVRIGREIEHIEKKLRNIKNWHQKLFWSSIHRTQMAPWDSKHHIGIIDHDVYQAIISLVLPTANNEIFRSIETMTAILKNATKQTGHTVPTIRDVISEIKAIIKSWEAVRLSGNYLYVKIKDIILSDNKESINLGCFEIRLNISDPSSNDLVVTQNDSIESDNGYPHPHIDRINNKLCVGEGFDIMQEALIHGRLEDYFRIIEAILRTYNPRSAYEGLEEWYNPDHDGQFKCYNCLEWCDDEDGYLCDSCNTQYCNNCVEEGEHCINCHIWFCSECSTSCKDCGGTLCEECINLCSTCSRQYCQDCLESCNVCGNYICDFSLPDECDDNICKECKQTCDECNQIICNKCYDICEYCGTRICSFCKEEHNCILAVNNQRN